MLQPNDTLNHGAYRIEGVLGEGGFGVVYRAMDVALHRLVAIKTLQQDWATGEPAVAEAFLAEARLAARLGHPHIVPIYFVGEEGGLRYLVMEYLPGGDVEMALARGVPPLPEALRWLRQIAEGLAFAHRQGIVHRDLKLRNVLLTADRDVKIADFGLAKAMGAQTKTALRAMGTPAYVAPEQIQGRSTDARSDLYSFGVLAYQLVTGRLPYDAPDIANTTARLLAITYQHVHAPIPSARAANPAVPPVLDALLHQLLAKTPEARPASATEVAQALAALAPSPDSYPIPPTAPGGYAAIPPTGVAVPGILPTQAAVAPPGPGISPTVATRPPRRPRWPWLAVPALLLVLAGGAFGVKQYLETEARRASELRREAEEKRQAEAARQAQLQAEEERQRAEAERRRAEAEAQRQAEAEQKRAEAARQARLQAEEQRQRAEAERKRAEAEAQRQAEAARQARVQRARVIFEDDFVRQRGLPSGKGPFCAGAYDGAGYVVENVNKGGTCDYNLWRPGALGSNVRIELSVRLISGATNYLFGLKFGNPSRDRPADQFLVFGIDGIGSYRLAQRDAGSRDLIKWTKDSIVRAGYGQVNNLAVEVAANVVRCYINNKFVGTASVASRITGYSGLHINAPGMVVRFSHFRILDLQ
jgi:serine/threonine-protein kinase